MLYSPLYCPPLMDIWQGRATSCSDPEYIYQIVKPLDLSDSADAPAGVAILGFACDEGVRRNQGRPGAKDGPNQFKRTLAQGAIHTTKKLYDAGTITVHDNDIEAAQNALKEAVVLLLAQGHFPLVIGGGHETAWGHYLGIEKHLNHQSLTILNCDAHFDLRDVPHDGIGTSGTPFKQIADQRSSQGLDFSYHCVGIQEYSTPPSLFATAKTLGVHYLLAHDIHQHPQKIDHFVDHLIAKNQPLYLSLCLDVFAMSHAPGVSAPQVLGLFPWHLIPALKKLASYDKLISMDIVELNPHYDSDHRTAKLAAQLAWLFI